MTNFDAQKKRERVSGDYIGIEDAFLLKVVRHRVLSEERRLELDFSTNPGAFSVRRIGRSLCQIPAAELWAEAGALNLIELIDLAPGLVTYGAGDIDFQA